MRNNPALEQNPRFIKEIIQYDFTKTMGQYAVEIHYTNGSKDVFTTPMPEHMGNDKGEFDTLEDMNNFVDKIQKQRK